jgi:hypothetical protein
MICAICEIEAERGQRCASPTCERWICEACAEGFSMCDECRSVVLTEERKEERNEDGIMMLFQENVATELLNARAKYRPMASAHEGWAVLREEVDELWDEVKKKPAKRDAVTMYVELVQIAAMAQRMAEDICMSGKAVEL